VVALAAARCFSNRSSFFLVQILRVLLSCVFNSSLYFDRARILDYLYRLNRFCFNIVFIFFASAFFV
jgi:hypothetical protein